MKIFGFSNCPCSLYPTAVQHVSHRTCRPPFDHLPCRKVAVVAIKFLTPFLRADDENEHEIAPSESKNQRVHTYQRELAGMRKDNVKRKIVIEEFLCGSDTHEASVAHNIESIYQYPYSNNPETKSIDQISGLDVWCCFVADSIFFSLIYKIQNFFTFQF